MCKYCEGWTPDTINGFYLDLNDQKLRYDDDYDCAEEVNISFCPWCGRPLSTDKTKDIYFISDCQNASVYDMDWSDTEEEAKRMVTRRLEPDMPRYLYTYRLVRTQRVFLPSECIFEDVE